MNPSVPDRLTSAIRALNFVVLPALPSDASLAREQTQLVIGHLQITLAQYASAPDFETQEADDFRDLLTSVIQLAKGGSVTAAATSEAEKLLAESLKQSALQQTASLQKGLDDLLVALLVDGNEESYSHIRQIVIEQATHRADVDRRWFSLMGFDPEIREIMNA